MKNMQSQNELHQALHRLADDMRVREIGAIIWNLPEAGFHYIPELMVGGPDGKTRTVRVTGLYLFQNKVYAIEEDKPGVNIEHFYRQGVDVPPVVVTLSESKAEELFGTPSESRGLTCAGTLEEWTVVADCYFEALRMA